jgi:hypothetical protein
MPTHDGTEIAPFHSGPESQFPTPNRYTHSANPSGGSGRRLDYSAFAEQDLSRFPGKHEDIYNRVVHEPPSAAKQYVDMN